MRNLSRIPLFYHPTNVLLIDDEPAFLNNLRQIIDHNVPYITDTDPKNALDYLGAHTYQQGQLSSLVTRKNFELFNSESGVETFDINFASLSRNLDSPERFKKIAVVFVDQMMPTMDGLDFCKKIRERGILVRLILLTGRAGSSKAVEAFNNKIIDGYISKDQPNLPHVINESIIKHSWEYFIDLSSQLAGFLFHILKTIYNEKVYEMFKEVLEKYSIREFYLLNSVGHFMLFDEVGNAKELLMYGKEDFAELYDLANNSKAPYDIMQELRACQKVPVTNNFSSYLKLEGDQWEDVMMPVSKIPEEELYYIVVDKMGEEVFYFKKYFNEVWPEP